MTAEMLTGLGTELTSQIALILPICITVFGIMAGVKLVPKLIKKFM